MCPLGEALRPAASRDAPIHSVRGSYETTAALLNDRTRRRLVTCAGKLPIARCTDIEIAVVGTDHCWHQRILAEHDRKPCRQTDWNTKAGRSCCAQDLSSALEPTTEILVVILDTTAPGCREVPYVQQKAAGLLREGDANVGERGVVGKKFHEPRQRTGRRGASCGSARVVSFDGGALQRSSIPVDCTVRGDDGEARLRWSALCVPLGLSDASVFALDSVTRSSGRAGWVGGRKSTMLCCSRPRFASAMSPGHWMAHRNINLGRCVCWCASPGRLLAPRDFHAL